MSKNNYNNGYQDGYWAGSSSAYDQGYADGKRDEYRRTKQTTINNSSAFDTPTLSSMVFGSISLAILGWCFAGLLLLLLWIGGLSGEFLFSLVFQISLWGGLGFIVIMSIAGVIMTVVEKFELKNPPEKPADDPNLPWYRKYPPADVVKPPKDD